MNVARLSTISFDEILECFLKAFEDYYFTMPSDKQYHKDRWAAAKVDFNLSYGMFDNDKLVGFLIHAIDTRNDIRTAFNTATGVLPSFRGNRLVNAMYDYALGDLKNFGVKLSVLEVLTKNEIAIKSYKSNGFHIDKIYKCFRGRLKLKTVEPFIMEEFSLNSLDWSQLPNQEYYSWDNQKESLLGRKLKCYRVFNKKEAESYFIIDPSNNYLLQFDLLSKDNLGWDRLFSAIQGVTENLTIINVDTQLKFKIEYLNSIQLNNLAELYEMKIDL